MNKNQVKYFATLFLLTSGLNFTTSPIIRVSTTN